MRDRAAGRADVLGGDEVFFADQRRVRGPVGDDLPVGQVPPLHRFAPEGHIGGVGQFGVGALPVPYLMGIWPVTAIPYQGVRVLTAD